MKSKTAYKMLSLTSLMLVYACGNPHVDMKRKSGGISLPVINEQITASGFQGIIITTKNKSDSVNFVTKLPEVFKELDVLNPSTDEDILVSYKIEIGDNFKLKLGDCTDLLASTKTCSPQVIFTSTAPGIYKDNLIVSYRSVKDPSNQRNKIVPLLGQRLADLTDPASIKALIFSDDGNDKVLISTSDSPVVRKLSARNPNETEDLTVSFSMESGEFFKISKNDCKDELLKNASCSPIVTFKAPAPGVYKDTIVATYTSKTDPELSKKVLLPIEAELVAKEIPVNPLLAPKVSGESSFSTPEKEHKSPLLVENVDPDDELILSYKLESGKNFKIDLGTCSNVLEALKSCTPVILFSGNKPGTYKDNLIVTYASKSNPEVRSQVVTPLSAEILPVIPTDIGLDIIPNLGANGIDFGKSLVNQAVSQLVILRNPTDHDLSLVSKKVEGPEFELGKNGTCKKFIQAHQKCSLEVIFNSSSTGITSRSMNITYASIYGGAERNTEAKLLGEKIKDLNDCGSNPCGEPQLPGKLEFSTLNGAGLDFGQVGLESRTKQTIPLINSGDLAVEIESLTIKGEGFELKNNCPQSLLKGQCSLEVSFSPAKEQSYSGLITVKAKDGQILKVEVKGSGKDLKRCFKKTIFHVTAESTLPEKLNVLLPYLNSVPGNPSKISNLYGMGHNHSIKSLNRFTVLDAQVTNTFKFDGKITGKIQSVEFYLNTSKVLADNHEDTEAVCLSSKSINKCSGKDFDTKTFLGLKNPKFWAMHPIPVNDLYEATLLGNKYKCGNYTCANLSKSFSANKLFNLTDEELASMLSDRYISLILTDDTRNISMPTLKVTTAEEVTCKSP